MAATREKIRRWLETARERGATHMVVRCDTFDWEDYPSYIMPGDDPKKLRDSPGEMQKVMECYSMALSDEEQLAEFRALHWE